MKFKKLLTLFIILLSCSSLTEKQIVKGEISIRNGRVSGVVWEDDLKLKRRVWFQGMKLDFDQYLGKISKTSGFINWFKDEYPKENCENIILSLTNNNFGSIYLNSDIVGILKSNGLTEFQSTHFLKSFQTHPDYRLWNLNMYKPRLFCSRTNLNKITLRFANHKDVEVSL